MISRLDDLFARVQFGGPELFERDEYGLPMVIEDDPEDVEQCLPWLVYGEQDDGGPSSVRPDPS